MAFFLGGGVDSRGRRTDGPRIEYDPSDLTTHGVIIGMTGSGKTGLGVIYLEEALRSGIPTLVIDPKGDMTNLLLTFPDLAPEDFEPWVDAAAAEKEGRTRQEEAAQQAATWSDGLASWGLSGDDIGALRATADMTIYTPGSRAGVPLDVVGDLGVPDLSWDAEAETIRDAIEGYVSGLLGLVEIDADPISSREHILLANLIEASWRAGRGLTLAGLISQIVTPPIRKLGVFDIDTFFPEKDRTAFAMRLNGLLASPSFASWMDGATLDIESLLWHDDRPRAAIVYLAHLSDTERQFIVAALFTKLITWMRSQPGSSDLRVLAYMDEVFGFVPPTAQPPAKKAILTLLKQARAFGVGMLLSTQNPVDLDYKAMSNAGTWCIGRLQTERDKARVLEAVSAASGDVDVSAIDDQISALGSRVFFLHNTRERIPQLFTTRWAMSYLRGPMTREEVMAVTDPAKRTEPTPEAAESTSEPEADDVGSSEPPVTAEGLTAHRLHPAASWADRVGFEPDGDRYEAAIAVTVSARYDESRIGLDHTEVWEAVLPDAIADPGASDLVEVDHDPRDFLDLADDLPYESPTGDISSSSYVRAIERMVRDHLDRTRTIEVYRHRDLDLVSRPGEQRDAFAARVRAAAEQAADDEMADHRSDFEARIRKARRAYEAAVRDADAAAAALEDARGDALLGAGLDLVLGRRPRVSSSPGRAAEKRLRRAEDEIESARADYEDLGVELEHRLREIRDSWAHAADDIEAITVGLESDDIDVTDVRVVWVRR